MEKRGYKKRSLAILTMLIISICLLFGAVSACLPFGISLPDKLDGEAIDNSAFTVTENTSDKLGQFDDGYCYVYTDKSLIDSYRAGNASAPRDYVYHKVAKKTGDDDNRGKQDNPYVISSVDDWTLFAKKLDDGTIADKGKDKFFVLANDIDFNNKTFYPVRFFKGTFYGMGHKLLNISVTGKNVSNANEWIYWNSTSSQYESIPISGAQCPYGYGVFCRTESATICDLIVENFNYMEMPATAAFNSRNETNTGGLVGISWGTDNFLNCHTSGKIESSITYGSYHMGVSGLIGAHSNTTSPLYMYRCSTEVSIKCNSTSTYCQIHGGLMGDGYAGGDLYTYDCAAKLTSTIASCAHTACGAAMGIVQEQSWTMENFVGYVNVNSTVVAGSGAFAGVYMRTPVPTLRNCYVEGLYGAENGTKSPYAGIGASIQTTVNNTTVSNINVVRPSAKSYWSTYAGSYAIRLSGQTEHESSAVMLPIAKTFFNNNYPQIWDESKIGSYDPDNSPVRSYLGAIVNYRHLYNKGDSQESVGLDDDQIVEAGDKLPDGPTATGTFLTYLNNKQSNNHVFVGWTDDPTGKSEPFDELPAGKTGSCELYAVWTLPDSYVSSNITASITSDKATIEYDSKEAITLTSKVTHTNPASGTKMTTPTSRYFFVQDGKELSTSENVKQSGLLVVTDVKDSGTYTFKYRITDGLEPLWYYEGDSDDTLNTSANKSVDIEIEKGKVSSMTLKDFTITSDKFYGMVLSDVKFTVKMFNKANIEVKLDEDEPYRWQSLGGDVFKGSNTRTVIIHPYDTDNYEDKYEIDVEFESDALVIKFYLKDIDKTLEAEVEYGNYYGPREIIYAFEKEYNKALTQWGDATFVRDIENKAPYFEGKAIVSGDTVAPPYDGEYDKISEIHTIEVTFQKASYRVLFDPDNGNPADAKEEVCGYGQFLKKPADPKKGDELFVGWYFDDVKVDEDGNIVVDSSGNVVTEPRAWRFNSVGDIPQDRVTKAVTLKAKYVRANIVLSLSVEAAPGKKLIARSKIQEGDLIVTAVYGSTDDPDLAQPVELEWSKYENNITYTSSPTDELLHVLDDGFDISVSYTFGSTTETGTANLTVSGVPVDISGAKFVDKIVVYDGSEKDHRIDPVKWAGPQPSEITGVTYVYSLDGMPIEENALKGLGDYIVKAVFTTRSKDFAAESLTATLSIRNRAELERPTFVGGVEYDGTEKRIEDYLDGFYSNYMEIVPGNGVSGTEVGRYTVYIRLTDGTWSDGSVDDAKIDWTIDKATLIPNWDEWEFVMEDITSTGFAPLIEGIASGLAGGTTIDYANDFTYRIYDAEGNLLDGSAVSEIGSYTIVATINGSSDLNKNYKLNDVSKSWDFVVVPKSGMTILTIEWSDTQFVYDGDVHRPSYVVKDRDGAVVTDGNIQSVLVFDGYEYKSEMGTYTIKVTLTDNDNYFIRSGAVCKFKITDEKGWTPDDTIGSGTPSGDVTGGGGLDLSEVGRILKEYWQSIVSGVCIILIIAFLSKAASYSSRAKRAKRATEDRYKSYYAAGAVGLFGLASSTWTIIMCVFIALTVVSLVIMILAKNKCLKAEDNLTYAREDYDRGQADLENRRREEEARRREEDMKMMFMNMLGGQGMGQGMPQGGYAYAQPSLGAEDIRGIVSETMTAMLPGVQQMLPQQASRSDELVEKLIEQNEKLMQQLAEQKNTEKVVEREVATSSVNDEVLKSLIEGQKAIMEKLANQSTQPQVQVIEKEVPIEKIVEKVVEVPVEKIVEKEVKVKVPVEKVVEKIVEKEVKVAAPAKPKKEIVPRLTLDEAYALLSKQQQKYFDGLKQYALSKPGAKEKKSTYAITIGQSTINPLLKLTIKKDMTVALFKMEDEYLKDIKRDATSDGTKVKVKETEVEIADAQACKVAKNMIDLREDQIERYNDLLKEQRAMNRKK